MSKTDWKSLTVSAVSNAFRNHYGKIIVLIIIILIGFSGFTIKTKKGTEIHKDPFLKDMKK